MSILYRMSLPTPILRRGFWLYVWKVCLPDGKETHYVGMTGDVTGVAQSAFGRVSTHLSSNDYGNALRRNMRRKEVELEDCLSLDFFTFGPVYPMPEDPDQYSDLRSKVAALEKQLWYSMYIAGYDMLNQQPGATAFLHVRRWDKVCEAFQKYFPDIKAR